jgi:glutamate-1-semialdehyde 2,1-aminomutase
MAVPIAELLEREERRLAARTHRSAELWARGRKVLAGGVASSFQRGEPWPVHIARGEGAALWDLDGTRRLDFHCGFGAMVQGHAHPAIGRALAERYPAGTHFAAAHEDAVVVAEELAQRIGLPLWRFTSSGTEATLDAIRIARGFTGREVVVKAVGAYHGHHDAVMVAAGPDHAQRGARVPAEVAQRGARVTAEVAEHAAGVPAAVAAFTAAVPFNDADALEARIRALDRAGRRPACVILEPALLLGIVPPEPGYLEAVREITRRFEVVLIFDEVKTGLSIAAGGAVERYGVTPDLITLAKALGGGLPSGAIGGSAEVMSVVESGAVLQAGTFNGNPLCMAAARVNLLDVLTPAAYERFDALGARMVAGLGEALAAHGLPGYALALGARGCVTFAPARIVDHASFVAQHDPALSRLMWIHAMNRGLFLAPGRPEQWTLSVAHTPDDVDAYVAAFGELCAELSGRPLSGRSETSAGLRGSAHGRLPMSPIGRSPG